MSIIRPSLPFGLLLATATGLSSSPLRAWPGHSGDRPHGPPPAAILACADLLEADACQFSSPLGEETGSCVLPPTGPSLICDPENRLEEPGAYPIVDTGQSACYNEWEETACPAEATAAFYGQDAQHLGQAPSLVAPGDGTVQDAVTGLTWQQSPDTNGDGVLDSRDKLGYAQARDYCANLILAGWDDWRLSDIKTLYSLIDFRGRDPSGYYGSEISGLIPFLDTQYFDFAYGDLEAGERLIDAQYASATLAVTPAESGSARLFGVNFADGRIKGYDLTLFGEEKTFVVSCVRGNPAYGRNDFLDPGDGTIRDLATGLMWARADSGAEAPEGLDWEQALAWVAVKNAAGYLGYADWRLPNVKELQSLVDYRRAPEATGSAAIDPLFQVTGLINEAGEDDFPAYWSSTTHANWTENPGATAAYVHFGRAMGYQNGRWIDVHGAGAQRSDPKSGDPADYPTGRGPQGDAIRIYNDVRLVRDDLEANDLETSD